MQTPHGEGGGTRGGGVNGGWGLGGRLVEVE